jgi:glycosyltransferase involved in cell wall biosynthesis
MLAQPTLTICVPSRNRQRYFQETIRSLLVNLRTDVEFVFADNSDDPAPMREFMVDVIGDPRVKFIPPGERVYSMVDNWERCLEAATGEFVCVIGDDDYADVDVIDLINSTKAERGSVDVFVWSRFTYNWPGNRRNKCNVCIPLGTGVHEVKREWLYEEFFTWKQHSSTPNCPFAIYHGAISKKMMDKIKAKFGGRYFEHPTVDFENSCKLLVTAETFFYSERPFSILGSCPESNSASIGDIEDMKRKHAIFMQELGRNMDEDPHMADFPFPSILGVSAAVALVQNWFKQTYGYHIPGWEKNFAEACGYSCGTAQNLAHYEMTVAGYETAFKKWKGGKYLQYFKPKYVSAEGAKFFHGVQNNALFIDEDIGGVQTPAELYHLVDQIVAPIGDLEFRFLPGNKRAA